MTANAFHSIAQIESSLWETAHRATALVPSNAFLRSFDDLNIDVFNQLQNLETQNEKLNAARDFLLLLLISGALTA